MLESMLNICINADVTLEDDGRTDGRNVKQNSQYSDGDGDGESPAHGGQ